jgi:hypothetical protein
MRNRPAPRACGNPQREQPRVAVRGGNSCVATLLLPTEAVCPGVGQVTRFWIAPAPHQVRPVVGAWFLAAPRSTDAPAHAVIGCTVRKFL